MDEEYGLTVGKYLLEGETAYQDLIINHQPLTSIFSSQVQRLTNPNSVYSLVKRSRQAMLVWSAIWSLILVYYFGIGALFFVILYELTKIQLLGNLFLSESLVLYPLTFLFGLVLFKDKLSNFQLVTAGLSIGLSSFLLGPIWPAIGMISLLLILRYKRRSVFIFVGVLIIFLSILRFISLSGYFNYYLYDNLAYTVPSYHEGSWILTIIKSFLSPISAFLPTALTPTLWVIRVLSLILITNLFSKKSFKKGLLVFALLALTNIRFVAPGTEGYAGFHILPWYAVFIFVCSVIASQKKFTTVLILLTILISLNFEKNLLFSKTDTNRDFYINYSTHISIGEVVKIMKENKDTLFVSPDAWLVYWQSDTKHLPKLFGYYAWMAGIPSLHKEVLNAFEKNPPTFFYCDNCGKLDLTKYLVKYHELKRDNESTRLYVLNEKAQKLTPMQKAQLDYLHFKMD